MYEYPKEVAQLINDGYKLQAIAKLRDMSGLSLKKAKELVDDFSDESVVKDQNVEHDSQIQPKRESISINDFQGINLLCTTLSEDIFANFFDQHLGSYKYGFSGYNKKDSVINFNCFTKEEQKSIRDALFILPNEHVFYFRDTSLLNTKGEGLAITNLGIHCNDFKEKDDNHQFRYISWKSITDIRTFHEKDFPSNTFCRFTDEVNGSTTIPFDKFYKCIDVSDKQICEQYELDLLSFFQTLVNLCPIAQKTDIKYVYDFEDRYDCPEDLIENLGIIDKEAFNDFPEIKEITSQFEHFDKINYDLAQRLDEAYRKIDKSSEKLRPHVGKVINKAMFDRGNLNNGDWMTLGIAAMVLVAGGIEQSVIEYKKEKNQKLLDGYKQIWDTEVRVDKLCQYKFLVNSMAKLQSLYVNLMLQPVEIDAKDCSTIAAAKCCLSLYSEIIYRRIIALSLLNSKQISPTGYLNFDLKSAIVRSEVRKWPQLISSEESKDWNSIMEQVKKGELKSIPVCLKLYMDSTHIACVGRNFSTTPVLENDTANKKLSFFDNLFS